MIVFFGFSFLDFLLVSRHSEKRLHFFFVCNFMSRNIALIAHLFEKGENMKKLRDKLSTRDFLRSIYKTGIENLG